MALIYFFFLDFTLVPALKVLTRVCTHTHVYVKRLKIHPGEPAIISAGVVNSLQTLGSHNEIKW